MESCHVHMLETSHIHLLHITLHRWQADCFQKHVKSDICVISDPLWLMKRDYPLLCYESVPGLNLKSKTGSESISVEILT